MESHIALAAEKLFQIGPIPITNSILTTWVVTFILIVFALVSTRKIAAVPSSLQNFAEILVESFQNLVASIAEDKTKIFLPIVASFFFFILLGNYFGLLPGFGTIGFFRVEHGQKIFQYKSDFFVCGTTGNYQRIYQSPFALIQAFR